ncbi:hypothetical protein SAMN07250955_101310 [Arboricoccus pini]|uniref:Uncharacterized protein n=1 Tax=Arboricoccus pini TaxID=1963835 RepID=A0A212Q0Z0_9PROT|nr:hypothetical protein SAMN07250955_101310 [Arboricoccus pini]
MRKLAHLFDVSLENLKDAIVVDDLLQCVLGAIHGGVIPIGRRF